MSPMLYLTGSSLMIVLVTFSENGLKEGNQNGYTRGEINFEEIYAENGGLSSTLDWRLHNEC